MMSKLGTVIASIAGIVGLAGLGFGLFGGNMSFDQLAFTTQGVLTGTNPPISGGSNGSGMMKKGCVTNRCQRVSSYSNYPSCDIIGTGCGNTNPPISGGSNGSGMMKKGCVTNRCQRVSSYLNYPSCDIIGTGCGNTNPPISGDSKGIGTGTSGLYLVCGDNQCVYSNILSNYGCDGRNQGDRCSTGTVISGTCQNLQVGAGVTFKPGRKQDPRYGGTITTKEGSRYIGCPKERYGSFWHQPSNWIQLIKGKHYNFAQGNVYFQKDTVTLHCQGHRGDYYETICYYDVIVSSLTTTSATGTTDSGS